MALVAGHDIGGLNVSLEQCIGLYNNTVRSLRSVRYWPSSSRNFRFVLAGLNFQNLTLTRWGAAIGLDTLGPETNLRQLPATHPLARANLDHDKIQNVVFGLRQVNAVLERKRVASNDRKQSRRTLKELGSEYLNQNNVTRLSVAVHDISRSRESSMESREPRLLCVFDDGEETFQILDQIAGAVEHIVQQTPSLNKELYALAKEEIRKLTPEAEGLLYLNEKGFFKDDIFKGALTKDIPSLMENADETKAKVVWNLYSPNHGFQSSHISGGTFNLTNGGQGYA